MSPISIRPAVIEDAPQILAFVTELAIFEKEPHAVEATVSHYEKTIFADNSLVHALMCEQEGLPIGMAVYFFTYSTWQGEHGLYLEDLYISPEYRNLGAGRAMLKRLAQIALEKGCGRFEWSVLNWNQPAISLYESMGAKILGEWNKYRLSGQALKSVAGTGHDHADPGPGQ